ncbi:MAG: hypothetical protein QNJ40_20215 [Xanthomonadales bacterium]|nr:hypothetical protein [Xanthomonadales bacterium]
MARIFLLWLALTGLASAQASPPSVPMWVNNLGDFAFQDRTLAVAVDSQDNVYAGGDFGLTVDFDPGPGVAERTATSTDSYLVKFDAAGDFLWVKHFEAQGRVTDIVTDSNDNVIVAGTFSDTLVVDGTLTLVPVAQSDLFLVKLDASGNLLWGFSFGGSGDDDPHHLEIDSDDAIILSGIINGTVDVDPGPGVSELVAGIDEDAFVAKYSSAGSLAWAHSFEQVSPSGIAQSESAHGLAVDSLDNVFVGGQAEGNVVFSGNTVATGGTAAYLVKYNAAGVFQWVRVTEGQPGSLRAEIFGLGVDIAGNVYATGMFFGEVDFDPDPVDQVLGDSDSSLDLYLARFDPTGDLNWIGFIAGPVTQQVFDIHVQNDGRLTVGGSFSGRADFDTGIGVSELVSETSGGDCWFAHYQPDGALISAHHLPGTRNFSGQAHCSIEAISPVSGGDLAMAGSYRMAVDFDPGAAELKLTPQTIDGFAARYSQPVPLPPEIFQDGFETEGAAPGL